jgi:hypothetical protein
MNPNNTKRLNSLSNQQERNMKKKQAMQVPTVFYLRRVMLGGKHSGSFVSCYIFHSFRGFSGSVMAVDRDAAKKKIRKLYPDAEFWR